ncbi:MAM and LDL-receptor class A domain-containing protein 1-like [Stylophora pistillata]|uniref:MAM and LDL-receptor class A domain-containing protein 1-like n=1 Tax=Stylophora pistillata TaxID=50429 RepID=UPI000C03A721|nr:MAM and LDL-receptor class A domain-containing protein 1-like [Stylophora pistillata]
MSSGRYPFNETGLLISNSAKALRGQYHSTKDAQVETRYPFTSMSWTRVTFRLTKNYNTFIYLNNKKGDQDKYHTTAPYESNLARVLNLASMSSWGNVSSTQMWAVENIQLSDVSLWIKSNGDDFPENTLPVLLDKCNFDNSPCSWKIGNWTKRRGRVPSEGTGPCHLADCADNDFYIHLESSYPRSKGDSIRFESPFVVPAYKCLSFKYHMWGKDVGRLTVYTQSGKNSNLVSKWRLSGDQGNSWNTGSVKLQRYRPFKLIFEAVVGDGFLGDIALDDVNLSTIACDHSPDYAKSYSQASTLEKSAIIGHLSSFKSSLLGKLRTAHGKNNSWVPCYRALLDGRDIESFYSNCGEEKETVTIVRVNNYIFGGYTDVGWSEVRG